jgi:hypothetical protein
LVVGVVEAEHRLGVLNRRESFGRAAADALGWRVECNEIRVIALERLELFQQRIELGVGDLRRLMNVILIFVMPDQFAQFDDAGGGIQGVSAPTQRRRVAENSFLTTNH